MTGTLNPEAANASDDTGEVAYRPAGTGTANDGRKVRGVVLVDTTGNAYAASGGGGGGGGAATIADGADVAQGTTTDTSTATTVIGRLQKLIALLPTSLGQKLSSASLGVVVASDQSAIPVSGTVTSSVSNFPATQPVSGTVTANAGTGTLASSVADGSNVALGTTTDASSGNTAIGLLKNIKAALAGTLTISGSVTNSNLDVALSTRLKPADTLTAVTTVGAVTAITNALPAGANTIGAVKSVAQTTIYSALATTLTGTGAQTAVSVDGYDGAQMVELTAVGTVAAQAVTLLIEGSYDNTNFYTVGVMRVDAQASPARTVSAITITPGAATLRSVYQVLDTYKFLRVNPSANTLGTGLTANIFAEPI